MKTLKQFITEKRLKMPLRGMKYKVLPFRDGTISTEHEDLEVRLIEPSLPLIVRVEDVEQIAGEPNQNSSSPPAFSIEMISCMILEGEDNIMYLDDPINNSWKPMRSKTIRFIWTGYSRDSNEFVPLTREEVAGLHF